MNALLRILRPVGGAFEFATVAPVPARLAGTLSGPVLGALPVVGAALGVLAAFVAWVMHFAYMAPIAGLAAVAATILATRGLHIDGLSDTADGLGCYGPPERALTVMRDGSAGPFGVVVLIICLLAQALSFGVLASRQEWLAVALAITVGRISAVVACRRGVPGAAQSGFGTRVAGSQPLWLAGMWVAAAMAVGLLAQTWRPWQGPVVVAVALIAGALLVRHCVRRFGGITGDVLGASIEITTTVAALGFAAY
ncbi:cobalamin synthase [Mycobacteroides abscessus subsp. abscessus]|uniref:adenosylcobinamide-GDP ribazoletransferase n=1 Tax=Mycobacteroides abscessus TaxID=36809 RepID=UPI00092BD600|nr:adenosylcobinamide-GDP ribazoletransferase [Mycobacteroides abscessus]SHV12233.1 cobalamin synthase [Mycobacteroides abscessus subsp. abscessus]SHW69150.1 cobalamin synthase [Mycobacteroides abscessus subsp. abscessus]SIG47420.1 cobalamin synthase [Mycobacteroides abscessus subsp. abscessus]SKD19946.1 cobalamin synthase [Mycobacteroides abscessus subsp. abscessus]SKM12485.1 cobalamin synthase [Mycobacteroides abscessus subsp. abscessus]